MRVAEMVRQPSAGIPLLMSATALAVMVGHAALFGVSHAIDVGTHARVSRLLIAAELPLVLYFVMKWLPRDARRTMRVLGLQAISAVTAFLTIHFLG
jgi:ABC-type arginine/histidine transport system permease subunit